MSDSSTKHAAALPAHRIRVSRRARRISLRVLPGQGLEVVLPRAADPACVPGVLERHRDWIEKTLKRLAPEPAGRCALPDRLTLRGGLEEVLLLPFADGYGASGRRIRECGPPENAPLPGAASLPGSELAVRTGSRPEPVQRALRLPAGEPQTLVPLLRDWLRAEAGRRLTPVLDDIASAHGFAYVSARFRYQKSRWGSCSAKGALNLNACLIFLPDELARYILLHELCHTRQMNHGDNFWKLVFAADPDALRKDRAMRGAWRFVPTWLWI